MHLHVLVLVQSCCLSHTLFIFKYFMPLPWRYFNMVSDWDLFYFRCPFIFSPISLFLLSCCFLSFDFLFSWRVHQMPTVLTILKILLAPLSSSWRKPGMILINIQLNGANYHTWSKTMKQALLSKNKLKFINRSLDTPQQGTSLYEARRKKCFWIFYRPEDPMGGTWVIKTNSKMHL